MSVSGGCPCSRPVPRVSRPRCIRQWAVPTLHDLEKEQLRGLPTAPPSPLQLGAALSREPAPAPPPGSYGGGCSQVAGIAWAPGAVQPLFCTPRGSPQHPPLPGCGLLGTADHLECSPWQQPGLAGGPGTSPCLPSSAPFWGGWPQEPSPAVPGAGIRWAGAAPPGRAPRHRRALRKPLRAPVADGAFAKNRHAEPLGGPGRGLVLPFHRGGR